MIEPFELHAEKVRNAARSGDVHALEAALQDIGKFAKSAPEMYIRLVRIACDEAQSRIYPEPDRAKAAVQTAAANAIETAGDRMLDVQIHLLVTCLRVQRPPRYAWSNEWPGLRRNSAVQWFNVWGKLNRAIDPGWRLNDPNRGIKPYYPPPNVPFDSGMSPDDIQDPKIREAYKAHQKKNQELTEENKRQMALRKVKEEYQDKFKSYIACLYSVPPLEDQELTGFLKDLNDPTMESSVLGVVHNPRAACTE